MSNRQSLTKADALKFQHETISRIADYVYDLQDNLSENGMDLLETKKEVAWTRKAIEVELEGLVSIVEEFHNL